MHAQCCGKVRCKADKMTIDVVMKKRFMVKRHSGLSNLQTEFVRNPPVHVVWLALREACPSASSVCCETKAANEDRLWDSNPPSPPSGGLRPAPRTVHPARTTLALSLPCLWKSSCLNCGFLIQMRALEPGREKLRGGFGRVSKRCKGLDLDSSSYPKFRAITTPLVISRRAGL